MAQLGWCSRIVGCVSRAVHCTRGGSTGKAGRCRARQGVCKLAESNVLLPVLFHHLFPHRLPPTTTPSPPAHFGCMQDLPIRSALDVDTAPWWPLEKVGGSLALNLNSGSATMSMNARAVPPAHVVI